MKNDSRWISYDWYKLIAALVLLFVLILSLALRTKPQTSLPPYPPADTAWHYDAENQALLDAQGTPAYVLTDDGLRWQPVIPPAIAADLPQGYQLMQKLNGDWVILSPDGQSLAQMTQKDTHWSSMVLPMPPTETAQPTSEPTSTPLPTATQQATAQLMVLPTSLSGYGCQTSAPSQLAVGDTVVALSNLYMRKVPYVADNVITYNVVGAHLKIIDGPRCMPHEDGYYIWWLVESPYGIVGWSEETTLHSGEYLMEPVP